MSYTSPNSLNIINVDYDEIDVIWDEQTNINTYRIQITTTPIFINNLYDITTDIETYTFTNLQENTLYYIRITSLNPETQEIIGWYNTNFTTVLENTTLISSIKNNRIELSWLRKSNYLYKIQVSQNNFTDILIDVSGLESSYTINNLVQDTFYYVRIKSYSIMNESNWKSYLYETLENYKVKNIISNGIINDILIDNNNVILAGVYSHIGGTINNNNQYIKSGGKNANNIVLYDLSETIFYNFGLETVNGTNGEIYEVKKYNNYLFVGGKFSKANNNNVVNLTRWDISDKTNITLSHNSSYNISGIIYSIVIKDNFLIIGGSFVKNNINNFIIMDINTNNFYKYINPHNIERVSRLIINDNNLYIAGRFQKKSNDDTNLYSTTGENINVKDIEKNNDDLYIAGKFKKSSNYINLYTNLSLDIETNFMYIETDNKIMDIFNDQFNNIVVGGYYIYNQIKYLTQINNNDFTIYDISSNYPVNKLAHDSSNNLIIGLGIEKLIKQAILPEGNMIIWGDTSNNFSLSIQSFNNISFVNLFKTDRAIAVLHSDNSISTYGDSNYGGSLFYPKDVSEYVKSDVMFIVNTRRAFAAYKSDTSVIAWGDSNYGGDTELVINDVSCELRWGVEKIFSNDYAFSVLKENGTVITWGNSSYGGNSNSVKSSLVNVIDIFNTETAFCALKDDGTVVVWGDTNSGGSIEEISGLSNIVNVYSTKKAFCALKSDGTVITWGDSSYGGNSDSVINSLVNIINIYSTDYAFCALKNDNTVITWGNSLYGGDSSSVSVHLTNIMEVYSTKEAFAALKYDKTVITWGNENKGGIKSIIDLSNNSNIDISNTLTDIIEIFSNNYAFAGLKQNGDVITWGDKYYGGYTTKNLNNVVNIYNTIGAFAALKEDNTVVAWGHSDYGGDTTNIDLSLNNITKIFGNDYVFIGHQKLNFSVINDFRSYYDQYEYIKYSGKRQKRLINERIIINDEISMRKINSDLSIGSFELFMPDYSNNIDSTIDLTDLQNKINLGFIIPVKKSKIITFDSNNIVSYNNRVYQLISGNINLVSKLRFNDIEFNLYSGGIVGNTNNLPCFVEDTYILTPSGYVKITQLKDNDIILTSDNRQVNIVKIYSFTVIGNNETYPYIIPKNSIDNSYPPEDVKISGKHLIKYKDGWIEPRRGYKNIKFIQDCSIPKFKYFHIKLPNYLTDFIVINNGCVVESFNNKNIRISLRKYKDLLKIIVRK